MEDKTKTKKSRKALIIILLIACSLSALFGIPALMKHHDLKQKKDRIEYARAYFENDIPGVLRDAYKDFPLSGELVINAESKWTIEKKGRYPVYRWNDVLEVILKTDASFDELSERERCDYLSDFGVIGINAYQNTMVKVYPNYFRSVMYAGDLLDNAVFFDRDQDYFIKTPTHSYRYIGDPDAYGIGRSGAVFRLKDPQSQYYEKPKKTPTPTPKPLATYVPTPRPSKSAGRTDPDEAHLYDDPDEYADDYAEWFAEQLGEDSDAGYDEAYSHWWDWHEDD